jgi:hypothetical protein
MSALAASTVKRLAEDPGLDIDFALGLALTATQSFLSPTELATVRFKLNRSTLDALLVLADDSELRVAIDSISGTAFYEDDSQFMIQLMQSESQRLLALLAIDNTWAVSEYSADIKLELKQFVIDYISSFCAIQYLPDEIARDYRRYFSSINYPQAPADQGLPPRENNYTGPIASLDLGTEAYPIPANDHVIVSGDRLIDIRKRCAVQLKPGFSDMHFYPEAKLLAFSDSEFTHVYWGERGYRGISPTPKGRIELSQGSRANDVLILSASRIPKTKTSSVSVFSTADNRVLFHRVDESRIVSSINGLQGDYLINHVTQESIPLRAGARRTTNDPTLVSSFHTKPRARINFRAGIASKQMKTSPVAHIYDVQLLATKLKKIYAAVDAFWQMPGVPDKVYALSEADVDRWNRVKYDATRETLISYRQDWVLNTLREFEASKFDDITAEHLVKLLK